MTVIRRPLKAISAAYNALTGGASGANSGLRELESGDVFPAEILPFSIFGLPNGDGLQPFPFSFFNLQTVGKNDLYTVPAGKRLIIIATQFFSGAANNLFFAVKINGIYYRMGSGVALASPGTTSITTSNGAFIFEAGQTVSIDQTAAGGGLNCRAFLVNDTYPLKSFRQNFINAGTQAVYICPAGKTAIPIAMNSYIGSTVGLLHIVNDSGAAISLLGYFVTSGQTPQNFNAVNSQSQNFNNAAVTVLNFGGVMAAGDSLQVNSSSGTAGLSIHGVVYEYTN